MEALTLFNQNFAVAESQAVQEQELARKTAER